MTLFRSASMRISVTKAGVEYDVKNYPIFFNSISYVRAEMKMSDIAMIEVKLTPSYDDAVQILKDGLLGLGLGSASATPQASNNTKQATSLNPGAGAAASSTSGPILGSTMNNFATMQVQFVRPGEEIAGTPFETNVFAGAVTQPDATFDGSNFEITMRGYANTVFLAGPEFITPIRDKTVFEVVEQMAKLIDRKITFDDGDTETEQEMRKVKLTDERRETPLATIKWALSHVSCEFISGYGERSSKKDDFILVRKIASMFSGKPRYTFVNRRQIDLDNNVIPMLNFNMQGTRSLFISGRAFGSFRLGFDSKTKKSTQEVDKDMQQKETSTTDQTALKAKLDAAEKAGFIIQVLNRSPTQDTAPQAQTEIEKALALYQTFTFSIPGIPDISPMQICQIRIADVDELSGVLLVTKVAHIWDSGGWVTEVEGRMTGGLGTGTKNKLSAEAPAPYNKASERKAERLLG